MTAQTIPMDKIVADHKDIQIRRRLNRDAISRYADSFKQLPPVVVYDIGNEDGTFILVDGYHRQAAALALGLTEMQAEIIPGTVEEARIAAATANANSGVPLTTEERNGAIRLLKATRPDLNMADIARLMGVSRDTVSVVMAVDKTRRTVAPMLPPFKAGEPPIADQLSDNHIVETLPLKGDPSAQAEVIAAAQRNGWTRDQTRRAVAVMRSKTVTPQDKRAVLEGRYAPTMNADGELTRQPATKSEGGSKSQASLADVLASLASMAAQSPQTMLALLQGVSQDDLAAGTAALASFAAVLAEAQAEDVEDDDDDDQ